MQRYVELCKLSVLLAAGFSFFTQLFVLALPLYMLQLFDRVFASRSLPTLAMLTLITVAFLLASVALELVRSRLLVRLGATLDGVLGRAVLDACLARAAEPSGSRNPAELRDVYTLRNFLTGAGIFALFDAPWAPVFIGLIFFFHPLLGVVSVAGALLLLGLALLDDRGIRKPLGEANELARRANAYVEASVRNAEAIAGLGMRGAVADRWRAVSGRVGELQTVASRRSGAILAATKFARLGLQVAMLGIGAYLVIDQTATPGIMMAGTIIFARAIAPVEQAVATWKSFVEARGAYRRLDALLSKPQANSLPLPAPEGALSAENVGFEYEAGRTAVSGVSFRLAPGEALGIFGPSASGKSTMARLIVGLWKPSEGTVRLDGADISAWEREALGRYIGYLPQDVELFSGTVADNIARLADPVANAEEVIAAAKRAHVHEMALALPNGYDTDIGEAGARLSGGQRQRIGLARALFGNPKLVVLDEPNSNLDSAGDEALAACIDELKSAGTTVVVITHRMNLLRRCDKLMLINRGRPERCGPRQEVMAELAKLAPGPRRPRPVDPKKVIHGDS